MTLSEWLGASSVTRMDPSFGFRSSFGADCLRRRRGQVANNGLGNLHEQDFISLLRLRVVADSDPAAIGAVIQRFQNLNIVPRRMSAEFGIDDRLHIEVDVCGVSTEQLSAIS